MIMRYSIKLYHYYFSSEVRETKKIIKSLEDSLKEKEKECKDPNYSIIPGEASFFWSVRESITLMKVSIEME